MRITVELQNFQFYQSYDVPKPLTFSSRQNAFDWLKHTCSRDRSSPNQFRRLLSQSLDHSAVLRLTEDEVFRQLANLLYTRRIVAFGKIRYAPGGSAGKQVEECAPPFPLAGHKRHSGNTAPAKTWISIVLNDSDGNPVPGEEYRIELPGGRVVEGHLDRLGTAAVSGIDPGQCKVSFPRLPNSVWAPAGGGSV